MTSKIDQHPLFKTQLYIDGNWQSAQTGETFAVFNPATGSSFAQVADASVDDTRAAITAAHLAQKSWKLVPAKRRAQLVRRWFEVIIENQEALAQILTAEQGKTLDEARDEILYGASYIEWFSEEAKRIDGDVIAPPSDDKRILVLKQPVGVVASITPWNFPMAMIARKAAPALAAGCTFVGRPATETPLSALAIAALADEAGIPRGVFNIVCGTDAPAIGREMTSNPKVAKLTFTGSTPVGKQLLSQCASSVKRTSMELGGNAPLIVFNDADMDLAIAGTLASKFRNSGQICVCSNRIFVQSEIYDAYIGKLRTAVTKFELGNGSDANTNLGPLINPKAAKDVDSLVKDALGNGARLVSGGFIDDLGSSFYAPTVLADVTTDMRVFREEIFGPVAPIFRFESEEEAIQLANDTEAGLASYFYTSDYSRIWRIGEALEYGIVGINESAISNEMAPFGGIKESGIGREGSKYGIDDYVEIKYLCIGGIER